jgi:hypothetical protein
MNLRVFCKGKTYLLFFMNIKNNSKKDKLLIYGVSQTVKGGSSHGANLQLVP